MQPEAVAEGVIKNFPIVTKKHRDGVSFFSKVVDLLKKRLQNRCFHMNIAKLLRKPILKNICERLLLCSLYNSFPICCRNPQEYKI